MGIGGIGIWQLLIVLLIILLIFGSKKLRSLGSDLGAAVKGFRKGMEEDKDDGTEERESEALAEDATPPRSIASTTEKHDSTSKT